MSNIICSPIHPSYLDVRNHKNQCVWGKKDYAQQPIKQFIFWFILFPFVQIPTQKLANVSSSCQDRGTFALAHINAFFSLFLVFWVQLNKFFYSISSFLMLSFFHTKESFLDFSTALCLYLLIKHWQVYSSKCSSTACSWAFLSPWAHASEGALAAAAHREVSSKRTSGYSWDESGTSLRNLTPFLLSNRHKASGTLRKYHACYIHFILLAET